MGKDENAVIVKNCYSQKNTITVKARKALEKLWWMVDCRGRCWGLKRKFIGEVNPYKGTNITMFLGDQAVTICKASEDKVKIIEFKKTLMPTVLGNAVRDALRNAEVKFR